jgi:hypothetical protein
MAKRDSQNLRCGKIHGLGSLPPTRKIWSGKKFLVMLIESGLVLRFSSLVARLLK